MNISCDSVYRAIDEERDYQGDLWPNDGSRTVGDFLTYLAVYVGKAQRKLTNYEGDQEALHEVRKIAALAVACMEKHGALRRSEETAPAAGASKILREHTAFVQLLDKVHGTQTRQVLHRNGQGPAVALVTMKDFDVLQAIDGVRNCGGTTEGPAEGDGKDGTDCQRRNCVPHNEFSDRY